jgi:hypothetical protein
MRLYPASWKFAGYKHISVLMVVLGVTLIPLLIRSRAPYLFFILDAILLLTPIWYSVSAKRDREYKVYVVIDSNGIKLEKDLQPRFCASWDQIQDIQICQGIRDAEKSHFSYDCYHVCLSNQRINTITSFDKKTSLNYLLENSSDEQPWVIYCNRGTKKECQELMLTILNMKNNSH